MTETTKWTKWMLLFVVALATAMTVACVPDKRGPRRQVAAEPSGVEHVFTFEARMTGFYGVGGEIDGQKNPVLKVNQGDRVTLNIINDEMMAHDIVLEKHDARSEVVMKRGERTSVTFVAKHNDTYFCSIPGHRQAGMVGTLEVGGGKDAALVASAAAAPAPGPKALAAAKKTTVDEIGASASDIPGPLPRRGPTNVEFTIRTTEVVAEIEDGTTFEYWTFDDIVPGPFLRVREGDTVTVNVVNPPESKMAHSIDFHSVTGPGGGAVYLQVPPGETRSITFKAQQAGLFIYHCATPHIPTHLARGMYGMMLVEPAGGLPKVDREFYLMQGDFYTTHRPGTKGHQVQDDDRLLDELPTYVVLNGRVGSLTGERALKANVGETVRIFYGVGGPNLVSSLHVIGEIFDRVYTEAALLNPPLRNVQTTLVPAGGATMVEFKVDLPGSYLIVDHSLSRLDKGMVGILEVEGPDNPELLSSDSEFVPH